MPLSLSLDSDPCRHDPRACRRRCRPVCPPHAAHPPRRDSDALASAHAHRHPSASAHCPPPPGLHPGRRPAVWPPRVCSTAHRLAILLTSPPPDCPPDLTTTLSSAPRASCPTSPPLGYLTPTCVPDHSPLARPSFRPHRRFVVGPPFVAPYLTTARLSGPHVCARPLLAPMLVAQLGMPAATPTPRRALRPAPPPRHRCLFRDQRLLQPGPTAARHRPLPCPTLVLLPIKCRPIPTVMCRSTALPGNAETELILRGVMHAWLVAVRSLNFGVNSWC
jgi:hypothetical protein